MDQSVATIVSTMVETIRENVVAVIVNNTSDALIVAGCLLAILILWRFFNNYSRGL